ncbi:MAG: SNF2-related protein [Dehalococcoidia bacterium]
MFGTVIYVQMKTVDYIGNTFKISFPYDPATVAQVRTLPPGRKWDPITHSWWCPPSVDALTQLRGWGFEVLPAVVKWEKEWFKPNKPAIHAISDIPGLKHPLYPFQAEGVGFIEDRGGRVLVADEMGLGKTVQALAWLQLHPDVKKAVIICPASLKGSWMNEIANWVTDEAVVIYGGRSQREELYRTFKTDPKKKYLVLNYDILSVDLGFIQAL